MNDFDIIKSQVDLLDHIRKRLGEGKKEGNDYKFLSPGEKTASLIVYGDYKTKGYSDFSGRLGAGTVIDFEMNFLGCTKFEAMKSLAEMYRIELSKKEPRKKSPKQIEVFENFDTYRMQSPNDIFVRWIKTRGFTDDTMRAYKENIIKVSKELGTCEGLALGNSEFRDVVVFPCYNSDFERVGAKLRRADGEKIGEVKSKTIKDTKTGLLYNPDDLGEEIYICEGEVDYFVLKSLGFFSVIGNLSGVNGGRKEMKKLLKYAKKVICLYDKDKLNEKGQSPGIDGAFKLQEELGYPIRFPNYPKFDGLDKCDINDLFMKKSWREDDFQKLFNEAEILSEEKYNELKFEKNSDTETDDLKMKSAYEINVGIDAGNNIYFREEYIKNELRRTTITNFVIEIVDIFREENPATGEMIEYFMIEITGDGNIKRQGKFRGEEIGSVRKFREKVKSLYGTFLCAKMTDNDLEGIIKLTKRPKKYTYSTNNIGYFPEKDCWIFDEGIIKDRKFYGYNDVWIAETEDFRIESLQRKNGPANCLEYIPDHIYNREIKYKIPNISKYIFGAIQGDFVLGWIFSTIFYTPLERDLTPFPILSLTGEKESGKTSGLRVIQKCVSMKGNFIKNWESTSNFVEIVSAHQTVSLFTPRDEMRNSEVSKKKESYLRNRFDRTNEERGDYFSSSQKRVYKANSALCVSGEQNTEDPAAFSRLLMIYMRAERDNSFTFDEINELSDYFPSVFRELLEEYDFSELKKIYLTCLKKSNEICVSIKGLSPRSRIVYSVPLAGFLFYNNVLLGKDFEVTKEYLAEIQSIVDAKKNETDSLDNIDDFMQTIIKIYQTTKDSYNQYSFYETDYLRKAKRSKDEYGLDVAIIDYNILYDKYVIYKKSIMQNPEQKGKIKRKLISDYGATESTAQSNREDKICTKRVLRIPLEKLSNINGFLDLIDDIEEKKKIDFSDSDKNLPF